MGGEGGKEWEQKKGKENINNSIHTYLEYVPSATPQSKFNNLCAEQENGIYFSVCTNVEFAELSHCALRMAV